MGTFVSGGYVPQLYKTKTKKKRCGQGRKENQCVGKKKRKEHDAGSEGQGRGVISDCRVVGLNLFIAYFSQKRVSGTTGREDREKKAAGAKTSPHDRPMWKKRVDFLGEGQGRG